MKRYETRLLKITLLFHIFCVYLQVLTTANRKKEKKLRYKTVIKEGNLLLFVCHMIVWLTNAGNDEKSTINNESIE